MSYQYKLSSVVENFIVKNTCKIKTFAEKYSINPTTIETQIRLHIPFYSKEELLENNHIVEDIVHKLDNYFRFYSHFSNKIYIKYSFLHEAKLKGKNELYIETGSNRNIKIFFKRIDDMVVDKVFQQKLHYIKKYRKDTIDSFGLFLDMNDKYPICYASVSRCDRGYLLDALQKVNIVSNDFDKNILVITRAFSIENAPKNLMSKLFDRIHDYYKHNRQEFVLILTALNPVLGFKGSIFKGSSYFQFAKSPMLYYYDNNGMYLNRRSSGEHYSQYQKIEMPPIIWLARGLTKNLQNNIENNELICNISPSKYNAG